MTEFDYNNSGCENRNCKFIFSDGSIEYGVIATFFQQEQPGQYYLVKNNNMVEFKQYADRGETKKMKELCVPIDLNSIKDVQRIEKVSFKMKAKLAFQGLSGRAKQSATKLINSVSNDLDSLSKYTIKNILGKDIYVLNSDSHTRILVQKEIYGITVIDIIFHE